MRSADRRKAFFAVCMMAVLLFSHLGVCLWQTQIAQVQNLTAEVGGEAQGILRTTDSDYVSNALSAEPEAGLSQSMIVVMRKMTGAAEQRLFFSSFYCCFIQNSRDSLCRGGSAYRHGGVHLPGRLPHGAFCAQFRR